MPNSDSTASTSTSPMALTPESTGSSPDPSSAARKARRQTAFYPNLNSANKPPKPFSRSAAKRESVMMLGSIEHLQHYFTKTGIAAKKSALATHKGLVPALGGTLHIRNTSSISREMLGMDLPPSPVIPPPIERQFPNVLKFETDPDSLLPGVVEDLNAVSHSWAINETPPTTPFDVLSALKITTRAVRAIRNYVLSLPDESAGTLRAQYRSKQLGPGAIKQKDLSREQQQDPLTLIRRSALSLLEVLRELEERSRLPLTDDAYDAQSEGGSSTQRAGAATPDASASPANGLGIVDLPADRDADGFLHPGDASMSYSLIQVGGRMERVPVWEDEDDIQWDEDDEQKKKREGWDERLVIDHGWLYKQDIKLEDLVKERTAVSNYLDQVDEVLFDGKQGEERGWDRAGRRLAQRTKSRLANRRASAGLVENKKVGAIFSGVSADKKNRRVTTGMMNLMGGLSLSEEPEGMEDISEQAEDAEEEEEEAGTEASVDDDELPAWAKRGAYAGQDLKRAHALLLDALPARLREALVPPDSRDDFLGSLSSGQLLCIAYNVCVRRSKKPWGYVNPDGIHDIIALMKADEAGDKKEGSKSGWTFRRIDNLRLWIGAMKLRYLLPIQQPGLTSGRSGASPSPSASPSFSQTRFTGVPIVFDAKVVARREDGWQDMLETVLLAWVDAVVEEKRGER
ncbi:hypothetical protein K523DRAFT_234704 [Schizophyllum commune Tattone D]|nr:hypothetical protein K523DRAFT_234704 [Schizophyllum commune Tattone D]